MTQLIPMDRECLQWLSEVGGSAPTVAIPIRLFAGMVPENYPNMIELGLVKHVGEITSITTAGYRALNAEAV